MYIIGLVYTREAWTKLYERASRAGAPVEEFILAQTGIRVILLPILYPFIASPDHLLPAPQGPRS